MSLRPHRAALALLLAVASLAACQAADPIAGRRRVEGPSAPQAPLPSASGLAQAPASPSASPALLASLGALAPLPQSRSLSGRLRVDAAYALGQGVAKDAGTEAIAAEGGPVSPAGRVLAVGGADAQLSLAAGSLLSNHGSGVVSNAGGDLLSNHGSGHRLLLQALPLGEVRPAGGMLVGLVDLGAGRLLPVGLDAQGKPAYAVATDATGAFTVHAPPAASGSVALVASFPQATSDRRLALEAMVGAQAQSVVVDDDQALVVRYLRRSLAARFLELFRAALAFDPNQSGSDAELIAFANAKDPKDILAARAVGLLLAKRLREAGLNDADLPDASARVAQAFMGALDLPSLALGSPHLGQSTALDGLAEAIRRAREAARLSAQSSGGLAALAAKPELVVSGFEVKRPSDLIEAMVERYLTAQSINRGERLDAAMLALGMGQAEADLVALAFRAGAQAVEDRASQVVNETGVADRVFAALNPP